MLIFRDEGNSFFRRENGIEDILLYLVEMIFRPGKQRVYEFRIEHVHRRRQARRSFSSQPRGFEIDDFEIHFGKYGFFGIITLFQLDPRELEGWRNEVQDHEEQECHAKILRRDDVLRLNLGDDFFTSRSGRLFLLCGFRH